MISEHILYDLNSLKYVQACFVALNVVLAVFHVYVRKTCSVIKSVVYFAVYCLVKCLIMSKSSINVIQGKLVVLFKSPIFLLFCLLFQLLREYDYHCVYSRTPVSFEM
jgi:hypothetical protein